MVYMGLSVSGKDFVPLIHLNPCAGVLIVEWSRLIFAEIMAEKWSIQKKIINVFILIERLKGGASVHMEITPSQLK